MGIFSRPRRAKPPGDRERRVGPHGLKAKDRDVLSLLVKHGADLDQPRQVLHFLYAPTREPLDLASDEAGDHGYDVSVSEMLPGQAGRWRLLCERPAVVLTPEVVVAHGNFFDDLAQRFGLDYDGWEAAV